MRSKPVSGEPLAIALSYLAEQMRAPQVSARGRAQLAREMLRTARRFGIPVHSNQKLCALLGSLSDNQDIPPALYQEVARLFRSVDDQ